MTPATKPKLSQKEVESIIEAHSIDRKKYPCVLVEVRGYYLDSMGAPGHNDIGMYDDAAFWCTPSAFASFNYNCDPSRHRKGKGYGAGKGMASLATGVWLYTRGLHKGYPAFIQAAEVTVIRDGNPDYPDTGWFGINLHRGGDESTSSLGCQTVPPSQWPSFKALGYGELSRYRQSIFPVVLVTEEWRRNQHA